MSPNVGWSGAPQDGQLRTFGTAGPAAGATAGGGGATEPIGVPQL